MSHGARERLDKQLKQAQAELAQAQAALKKQQILQGSSPGPADSREAGALLQLPRAFKVRLGMMALMGWQETQDARTQ
mgnify:CR=1 FL=1